MVVLIAVNVPLPFWLKHHSLSNQPPNSDTLVSKWTAYLLLCFVLPRYVSSFVKVQFDLPFIPLYFFDLCLVEGSPRN